VVVLQGNGLVVPTRCLAPDFGAGGGFSNLRNVVLK
jgi:hypothetical protein